MEDSKTAGAKDSMLQTIKATPAADIAQLDIVKDRFVKNYNICHKNKQGELQYNRQVVHFTQLVNSDDKLKNADRFSLYACFITAAVKGYSFDPQDNEIYLLAMDGKAYLWRQAGAHVRRLIQTGQIQYAEQAKLVYRDDDFKVSKGVVIDHIENFKSEEVIAGYVEMVLVDGKSRYFIYRPSDWQDWRKKSKQKDGANWVGGWNGQPSPGFLRTKLVKHACMEKVWAIGTTAPLVDAIESVEVEEDDMPETVSKSSDIERALPVHTSPQKQQPQLRGEEEPEHVVEPDDTF